MIDQRIDEAAVFNVARKIESPDARSAYLDQVCGQDQELKSSVQKLLGSYEADPEFLASSPMEMEATAAFSQITEGPGSEIGPYKLREQIGEGGFGVVYVAEQEKPVARKVALKIIKPGMDSKDVIARFEAERQALALMEHPNVARVLDAGATDSGRPYFVMELVKGVPITEFCDDQRLSTDERLRLFIDTCRAVQHAHQKGIIHRDLKPSNIMVTMRDDKPVVKVIDFGVSKALSRKLTDKTVYTAYGQMIGTPLYMSPEQAQMNEIDVDTRSDVYSLGVLLYELLTGTTPFDRDTLKNAGFDELRRIISEDEPPRPSARVSTMKAEAISTISDRRKIDRGKLGQSYRGELDWIAMKALEKDRNRRYESSSAFAADVERYLADEPVQARPASVWYRFQKYARRRKVVLVSSALVALSLIAGAAIASWQALRALDAEAVAEDDRDRALDAEAHARENFRQAMAAVDAMLTQAAESELKDIPHLAHVRRRLLFRALEFYEQFLSENGSNPRVRYEAAMALLRVGATRAEVDQHQAAARALSRSRKLFEQLAANHPQEKKYRRGLAHACRLQGNLHKHLGDRRGAQDALRQSVEILENLSTTPEATVDDREALGMALASMAHAVEADDPATAEKLSRRLLSLRQRLAEESPKNTRYQSDLIAALTRLANTLLARKQVDSAEQNLRRAVELGKQTLKSHTEETQIAANLAAAGHQLGVLLWRHRRKLDEAIKVYRGTVELNRQLVDSFPSSFRFRHALVLSISNLAGVIGERDPHAGSPSVAEIDKLLDEAVGLIEPLATKYPRVPSYQSSCAAALNNAATVLREQPGKLRPALELLRRAMTYSKRALTIEPDNREYRRFLRNHIWNIADIESRLGRYPDAIATAKTLPNVYPNRVDGYCDAIKMLALCSKRHSRVDESRSGVRRLQVAGRPAGGRLPQWISPLLATPQMSPLDRQIQETIESLLESARERFPKEPEPLRLFATFLRDRGDLLRARLNFAEAYSLALDTRGGIDGTTMKCLDDFADVLKRVGQAEESYRTYVDYWQSLARKHPRKPKYRRKLGLALGPLAVLLGQKGKTQEAEQAFEQCRRVLKGLVVEFADELDYRDDLATCYYNFGYFLAYFTPNADRSADALKCFRRAIGHQEELAGRDSNVRRHRELARSLHSCALVRNDSETSSDDKTIRRAAQEAKKLLHRAIAEQEKALKIDPKVASCRDLLARHYKAKARIILNLQCWREAIAAENRSFELGGDSGSHWFILAYAHAKLGERQQAKTCLETGVKWHRQRRQPISDELYFWTRDLLAPVVAPKPKSHDTSSRRDQATTS